MPVREWLNDSDGAGISYSSVFEQREAARFALVPWSEFRYMPSWEKAGIVAHYRTRNMIDAALSKKRKQESK